MPPRTRQSILASPPAVTVETLYEQGRQCLKNRDYFQAGSYFGKCLELMPDNFLAMANLAAVLYTTGRISRALTTYRKALKVAPHHPAILNGIGNCYRADGSFDKAAIHYKKALKADDNSMETMYNLDLLHTYSLDAPLATRLQRFHDSVACTGQARVFAAFSLARLHESHGDHHRAFQYYSEANALQFSLVGYDEARYRALFADLEGTYLSGQFRQPGKGLAGCTSTSPIFVLGMPRSGTSLVEQILASHSSVYGAGEVSILPAIAERFVPQMTGLPFTRALSCADTEILRTLADLYLQRLSAYCPAGQLFIVDKTPNNFFLIGLIRLMFPDAPIIHCVRDPMDTCWSLFRHFFGLAHGYCYDQQALGRYYRCYARLMRHWHRVLPGKIHDVRYEQLVEAPEGTIRALLEYCGLPWEDRCLAFYRTKRVVNTASASQVRRPIYNSSIRPWLPVAEELAPLRAALEGCDRYTAGESR